MNVSAIIVTRGNVSLSPILDSLPPEWERVVWNNGTRHVERRPPGRDYPIEMFPAKDFSVYGRYAAIEHASGEVIYVQDDDVIVSDPEIIASAYYEDMLVCNMPQEFRYDFYSDHALVGFGAAFHRDAPKRAFDRWYAAEKEPGANGEWGLISRTCDIIFTGLTPRVLVDVPKENLPHAYGDDRMWRQPEHYAERTRMRELMLQVRDAT